MDFTDKIKMELDLRDQCLYQLSTNPLSNIWKLVKNHIRLAISTQLVGILMIAVGGLLSLTIKHIVESLQSGDTQALLWPPLLALGLTILMAGSNITRNLLSQYISLQVAGSLQHQVFDHFVHADVMTNYKVPLGEKTARMTFDINWLVQGVAVLLSDLLYIPIMILAYGALMFYYDGRLAILSLLTIPVNVVMIRPISKRLSKNSREIQLQNAEIQKHIIDVFRGLLVVKIFCAENREKDRLGRLIVSYLKKNLQNVFFSGRLKLTTRLINALFICVVSWYAFHRITVSESLALSSLVAFASILVLFYREINKASGAIDIFVRAGASSERIFEMLSKGKRESSGDREINGTFNKFEFQNVSFGYKDTPILRNINLEINRGQHIAIAGLSGSGKTTLIRLLIGLLNPDEGQILLDHINLRQYKTQNIRSLFSYSPQTTILFHNSIADNISYGCSRSSRSDIIKAAKLACAHKFILDLPNGYDTIFGHQGVRLSEGQCQRISIARALLKDAPIIILDESTSQIDILTEKRILKNCLELKDKTVITISHRPTSLKYIHCIYHIMNGKVVEAGSHKDLMEKGGEYRKFYKAMEFINQYR